MLSYSWLYVVLVDLGVVFTSMIMSSFSFPITIAFIVLIR